MHNALATNPRQLQQNSPRSSVGYIRELGSYALASSLCLSTKTRPLEVMMLVRSRRVRLGEEYGADVDA